MLFGPYEYLSPGPYEVAYKLVPPEGLSAGNIARLDVVAYRTPEETDKHQTVVKGKIITVEELTRSCRNFEYGLSFRSEQPLYGVEFRVKPLTERLKVKWIRLTTDDQAIWQHYYQLGGINSALGPPRSGYWPAAGSPQGTSGSLRRFEGGSIYWNDNKGMAFDVTGAIGEYWESMGGSTSLLGFPTSRPAPGVSSPNINVTTQKFEHSRYAAIISYLDEEDIEVAYEVYGAIGGRYFQEGGPGGKFGLPISGEEAWEWESKKYRRGLFRGGTILWNEETKQTEAYLDPVPDISIEVKTLEPRINEPLHIRITAVNSGGEAAEGYFSVTLLDPVEIEGKAWRKITDNINHIQYIKLGQEWWGLDSKKYPFHFPMVEAVLQPVKAAAVSIFDVSVIPLESGPFRIQYKFSMKQLFDLGWVTDPAYGSDTDIGQQGEHVYEYSIKVEGHESNSKEQPKFSVEGVNNVGVNSRRNDADNDSDAALRGVVRTRLHTVLDATFNMSELTELAFKLGLDYENLPSKTKGELITSLIAHLERRERIDDLVRYLEKERTNAYNMLIRDQGHGSTSDDG
jgi:hypothetical protein